MRRLRGLLVVGVLGLLLWPVQAQAWIEWIDPLSGPEGLFGLQFEGRLVCIGDRLPSGLRVYLRAAHAEALRATAAASLAEAEARADASLWKAAEEKWAAAEAAWANAEREWAIVGVAVHALSAADVKTKQANAEAVKAKVKTETSDQEKVNLWKDAVDKRQSTQRAVQSVFTSSVAVGVFWSACSTSKMRRASIDLGISFLRSKDDRFADSENRLKLTTLIPSFSWNVFPDARYDVVDVGIGGGMYWFSSTRMESIRGVVLQPWRVDLHAPSSWAAEPLTLKSYKRWAAVPVVRVGQLLFPSGFPPNAFNSAPGFLQPRIPSELVFTKSLFFNLEPFVRRSPTDVLH
jgi:hypothetical protein